MSAFGVLAIALEELARVVQPLTTSEFTRRERATSGSIGGHVRHCLDHAEALERAVSRGYCTYDDRVRGTSVERDPRLACERLVACGRRLRSMESARLNAPLMLSAAISESGAVVDTPTTVAREVAFVINHTTHHAALIAILLEDMGHGRPDRFGLAPTTPTLEAVCAQ